MLFCMHKKQHRVEKEKYLFNIRTSGGGVTTPKPPPVGAPLASASLHLPAYVRYRLPF